MKLLFILILTSMFFLGCLPDRTKKSEITVQTSWFDGVKTVTNLGGYPASIKIEWSKPLKEVVSYNLYYLLNENGKTSWELLDTLDPSATSYVHSDLATGKIYTYMIRAVDQFNVEETNNVQKATVAFEGINSVKVLGKDSVQIGLSSSTGSYEEVHVYAQPVRAGGVKKLVATAKGTVDKVTVTGLNSGMNYKFFVSAYINYLGKEDGNEIYLQGQTYSDSFGNEESTDTSYYYQGVMNVQAYGASPNAPTDPADTARIPHVRMVSITWPAFKNSTSQTKYRVIRSVAGVRIDTTATTACTASMNTSCKVCEVTGRGAQTCQDTAVAAAPKKYEYTIALVKKNLTTNEEWVEELPQNNESDFHVTVHIPPDNMVLVQRDAANYDMCYNLKRSTDPRKKQRCVYTGLGATPKSTGIDKPDLNLTSGYYDSGYNFFMDRYLMTCNWSKANAPQNAGMCGAGQTSGSCIGTAAPNNSVGVDGNIYLHLYTGFTGGSNCWVKVGNSWKNTYDFTSAVVPDSYLPLLSSNDPLKDGGYKPSLYMTSQSTSFKVCNAVQTEYGAKRLPRMREAILAIPLPYLEGEPNAITDYTSRVNIEGGTNGQGLDSNGVGYYQCANNTTQFKTAPTTLNDFILSTNTRSVLNLSGTLYGYNSVGYLVGTLDTSKCISRFGVQDGLAGLTVSDRFIRTNSTTTFPGTFQGITSPYDNGNTDYVGFNFDGTRAPSFAANGTVYNQNYNATTATYFSYYILPLGLPVKTKSSSFEDILDIKDFSLMGLDNNDNFSYYLNANSTASVGILGGGRWKGWIRDDLNANTRCVVEAE